MTEKKQYSEGVKTEAVRMVIEHGLSLREASRQLTIPKDQCGRNGPTIVNSRTITIIVT
jgi:transposase-like protein